MTKKIELLFEEWLDYNGFNENDLDSDSFNYVYNQLERGIPIEDVEYFG